jgi:hypothetical protein
MTDWFQASWLNSSRVAGLPIVGEYRFWKKKASEISEAGSMNDQSRGGNVKHRFGFQEGLSCFGNHNKSQTLKWFMSTVGFHFVLWLLLLLLSLFCRLHPDEDSADLTITTYLCFIATCDLLPHVFTVNEIIMTCVSCWICCWYLVVLDPYAGVEADQLARDCC